eukprot:COSAG02_NODE_1174_length_14082_cov_1929.950154_13_plen_73_part_00
MCSILYRTVCHAHCVEIKKIKLMQQRVAQTAQRYLYTCMHYFTLQYFRSVNNTYGPQRPRQPSVMRLLLLLP